MKLTNEEREKYKAEFLSDYSIDIPNGHITEDAADFWLSKIDTILEERNELIKGSLKKYFEEHNHDEICLNGALEALHLPILK